MKKLLLLLSGLALAAGAVWAQDIIVTRDSKKIEAKVLEVSEKEIRYKELDNLDGPTFVLSTEMISTITYNNGKAQAFEPHLVAGQDIDSSDLKEYPVVDLSQYHGFLLQKGNCVYIPTDSKVDYELAAQKRLKELMRQNGYWQVVNKPEQAHFIMQAGTDLGGRDKTWVFLRTRDSYESSHEPYFSNMTKEGFNTFYYASGETEEENIRAIDEICRTILPYHISIMEKPSFQKLKVVKDLFVLP